ncbi:protein BLISTER isoform X3 [Fagus crenata]
MIATLSLSRRHQLESHKTLFVLSIHLDRSKIDLLQCNGEYKKIHHSVVIQLMNRKSLNLKRTKSPKHEFGHQNLLLFLNSFKNLTQNQISLTQLKDKVYKIKDDVHYLFFQGECYIMRKQPFISCENILFKPSLCFVHASINLTCNIGYTHTNIAIMALRLRSSELKLGRQLENAQAEISSYKKKMSSLEKDRQDLLSTIDALQEEKKLLQSKLRKASTSAKSIDVSNSPLNKRDMSTSTEDLDASIDERHETASSLESDASNVALLPENGHSSLDFSSVNIPSDQMRMIQNINALISELALEKEELMQALTSESSHCSKLKELNKELSRKLEAQTQRLELLTAQSMANENTPVRQPDSRIMHENTPYADEGDEVVERVLGWIMKLFPGGPSRRRTSKLL